MEIFSSVARYDFLQLEVRVWCLVAIEVPPPALDSAGFVQIPRIYDPSGRLR